MLVCIILIIDLPEEEMVHRRLARAKPDDPWDNTDYIMNGLLPGYRRHVAPQRDLAEHVVDGTLGQQQLTEQVMQII